MAITPRGMEPANIKKRLDTLFPKLNEAYPDKVIRSLAKDHKKWAETVTELYRTLGYPDSESFLKAYGYTVERAIPTGRPSHDYMAVIEELKKRYPNGATFKKIGELQEANPDLAGNFKTLANKSKELFGMSLADYFKSIGLLDGSDHKKQLDELLAELKRRYAEGTVLPATLAELKENNADLMVYRLSYIKEIYDVNPQEYLIEIGLLRDEQKEDEAFIHKWVELLLQRYDATDKKPETLNALKAQNPDCPFNDIAAKIQKTGLTQKDFFINAGLIVEKKYYTVDEEILLKEFGPDYLSEDAQYQRMCKFVQALTLNGNKKSSSQSVIFAAEAKLISQYRAAYHVEQKRSTITMAVHIDTLLRKKGLSEISVNDTIEFHHDTVNGSLALYVFTEQGKRIGCLSYHFSIINPLLACKDAYVVNGRIAYLKRPDHQNDYKEIIATFDLVFNQKAFSVLQCDGKELFEEKEIPFQLEECPDFAPPKAIAVSDDDDAWGNAIAKGLEKDVDAAIDHLDERGLQRPTKMPTDIPGIYQFQTGYPLEIIEEFPALKVLAFYIDYIDYSVSEVYSPSGCSQITASKVIGLFDPKADPSWYVECFPGKAFLKTFRWTQTSYIEKVTYTVPAREQWDDKYYFTFLENKLLKVILTTSAKADLENLQRTERTLQGEAERKHQEEAAAYKRALEMAHKAAEEEKKRREVTELKRRLPQQLAAPQKITPIRKTLIASQDTITIRIHIIAANDADISKTDWVEIEHLIKNELLDPNAVAVVIEQIISLLSDDCVIIADYTSMLSENWGLSAGWFYNRKWLFDDFPMTGNDDGVYPSNIDIQDVNTWVNEFIRQRLFAETAETYFLPLLEAPYLYDIFTEADLRNYQALWSSCESCENGNTSANEESNIATGAVILDVAEEKKSAEVAELEYKHKEDEEAGCKRLEEELKGKEAEEQKRREEEEREYKAAKEAERKHQEEAAAYKRALEMAHKAAEEEKQRREAAELERKCQEAADAERKRIEEEQRKRIEAEELKLKQAEEQKRREEEERKRKEAEEAERIRQKEARRLAEEKYAADLKAWERTCEDVKKQREQAVVERTAAERASLESAAQQTYESAIRAATQRKADAQQSKSDAEMRLSKLGIFKFAEKKSLKETIENAEREIYTANIALSTAKQALERAMAAVPAQLSANEPEIITGVEQDYPLPAKPEK